MSVDFDRAMRTTPARLDVGRAGARPRTPTWLAFQRDHAAARAAVWSAWSDRFEAHLVSMGFVLVDSAAPDRTAYLREPELGRRLSSATSARLANANAAPPAIQVVLSDGLSARAAEAHLDRLWPGLMRHLGGLGEVGVPVAVRNGRVAVGDAVALATGAAVVVHLIGERPGLGAADSLGCYVTFRPTAATADADRKCISNVRSAGLDPAEAGATIAGVCERILAHGGSGIDLVL